MAEVMRRVGFEVLVLDGAMGTMLHRAGMPPGECPELLNVTAPDMVSNIYRLYAMAGSDCTITNTFGGSRPKLAEYGLDDRVFELNREAVRVAKQYGAPHVLGDIGPTGLVLEPLGAAGFDEVFEIFAEQAAALAAGKPDAIFLETFTDIAEIRCAVLAIRSVCDLPIWASVTIGLNGRMDLSGTDPATAAVILEAAGADVVGMNCGLGPDQLLPHVSAMAAATRLPVVVQPNAGLPRLDDEGATVFPGTPDEMGIFAEQAVAAGAALVGSCCGSTPAFTAAIEAAVGDLVPVERPERPRGVVVAGPRRSVRIGGGAPVAIIGERINPTGKKDFADALRAGSVSHVRTFAAEQADAGATLLDVNVGAAGVDAVALLPEAVRALVGMSDLPLVIDTTDPEALEAALRVYPGRALVNSVNGEEQSLSTVLPLVKRYGAAVVVLALDDTGIPHEADGRAAIVRAVQSRAAQEGLTDDDLVVDALVMTAAADATAPRTTVSALSAAHAAGLATVLGVSNVSHGLPQRAALNAAFITVAAEAGLDAAIVNPGDRVVSDAIRAANAARETGEGHIGDGWAAWDAALEAALGTARGIDEVDVVGDDRDPVERLAVAIARGDAEGAPRLVDLVIEAGMEPGAVIGEVLTPAIQRLGDAFGRGEAFLPQLMVAAEAMKAAVTQAKSHLPAHEVTSEGLVVFATVKGDVHSIGKDICASLLESNGYEVVDLGVDVAVERVVDAAANADAVCLSALMTTTLRSMEETVRAVEAARPGIPVFVGGAVVTPEWAAGVGAGYAPDAPGCVEVVRTATTT